MTSPACAAWNTTHRHAQPPSKHPPPRAPGLQLNMHVAQLSSGDLVAYATIAPTIEVLEQLASLPGSLKHIILPNLSPEHFYYSTALAKHFPEARVWACPGGCQVLLGPEWVGGGGAGGGAAVPARPCSRALPSWDAFARGATALPNYLVHARPQACWRASCSAACRASRRWWRS